MPWFVPRSALIRYLTVKNASCAARGRPCPVAARVLARLESEV